VRITVNHLTRMKAPYVCVAGVDSASRTVRPVLADGQMTRSLLTSEGGPFRLGAVVDIGDPQPRPVVPEVEDVVFNPTRTRVVKHLTADTFREVLSRSSVSSLRSVFGAAIVRKSETAAAVPQHQGTASLGVLRAVDAQIAVRKSFGKHDIRVRFIDPGLGALSIKATDLRLWEKDQETPATSNIGRIESALDNCYLAVGLSRAFRVSSYVGSWHWLQINNVFPERDPLWVRE
jgi:Dual OB-containing domain